MGIQGLLRVLKSITRKVHISAYSKKKVAIDGYAWLHRGAYMCSRELCEGKPTEKFLDFCINMVSMLLSNGVIPVMVFDGAKLPQKRFVEDVRKSERSKNRSLAEKLLKEGNIAQAKKCFEKAVDVSPYMASQLIRKMESMNVECIVAPYEADAQLAFLSKTKYVSAIISEDSDLLVFGCDPVIFKLKRDGYGELISWQSNKDKIRELSFRNWSLLMFQEMCILSGCDYLPSIQGIGLKTAHSFISNYKRGEPVIQKLKFEKRYEVPKGYSERFHKACLTFKHQMIFDPIEKNMKFLNPLPKEITKQFSSLDFLGTFKEDEIAKLIAYGRIHPDTHEKFEDNPRIQKGITNARETKEKENEPKTRLIFSKKKTETICRFFKGSVENGNRSEVRKSPEIETLNTSITTKNSSTYMPINFKNICKRRRSCEYYNVTEPKRWKKRTKSLNLLNIDMNTEAKSEEGKCDKFNLEQKRVGTEYHVNKDKSGCDNKRIENKKESYSSDDQKESSSSREIRRGEESEQTLLLKSRGGIKNPYVSFQQKKSNIQTSKEVIDENCKVS